MKSFSVSKKHLKRLLSMFMCAIIMALCGVLYLVYDANHSCNDVVKYSGWMFIIAGVMFLFSTIMFYKKTIFEVVVNDDFICINKARVDGMNSKTINYYDIISVSCIEKIIPITNAMIVQIQLKTKTGLIIIDTIENANECAKLIKEQIGQVDDTVEKVDKTKTVVKKQDEQSLNIKQVIENRTPSENQHKCPYCGNIQSNTVNRCLKCSKMING